MGDIRFEDILHDELDSIARRRNDPSYPKVEHENASRRAEKFGLFGLCFSGGGIRSATFNLGVLQALQELKLLDKVDYLSTVSGGGYIGSWFISWLKRISGIPLLQGRINSEGKYEEPSAIRHLRRYSGHITPEFGLMDVGTWSIASIYVRNLLLNLFVLIPLLIAVLLIPRLLLSLIPMLSVFPTTTLFVISYLLLVIACSCVRLNLVWKNDEQSAAQEKKGLRVPKSFGIALACTLAASGVAAYILNRVAKEPSWHLPFAKEAGLGTWVLYGLVLFVLLWILALVPFSVLQTFGRKAVEPQAGSSSSHTTTTSEDDVATLKKVSTAFSGWSSVVLGGVLAGPVCGLFFYLLFHNIFPLLDTEYLKIMLGMPLALGALALVVMLQIGIAGSALPDLAGEWWSRFGGWLAVCTLVWLTLIGAAFYSSTIVSTVNTVLPDFTLASILSIISGVVSAVVFVFKSDLLKLLKIPKKLIELTVDIAVTVFLVGIVVLVSDRLHLYLEKSTNDVYLATIGVVIAIAVFFAWRVDLNTLSTSSLYYNRLTRCYLGGSRAREERNVNPVIGFDEQDDEFWLPQFTDEKERCLYDGESAYVGPFPIINTTINVVTGAELAVQKREALSFFFSPLYCGFENGRSDYFGRAGEFPIKLGRAISISGTPNSANNRERTSSMLSFLMTIFNFRPGRWFPNPAVMKKGNEGYVSTHGPRWSLFHLFRELFGLINERSSYVYLSDGGHFDNLGLYELVRRRCKFIMVCDMTDDIEHTFRDLGNAIEKCRSDFGVEIDLNVEPLRRDGATGMSKAHWVRGTIRYTADENVADGVRGDEQFMGEITYIKSSVTGDEPTDLLSYRKLHKEFPHELTADQSFDESQFESYRKLGYHIVRYMSAIPVRSPGALMSALNRPAQRRGMPEKAKRGVHSRSDAKAS